MARTSEFPALGRQGPENPWRDDLKTYIDEIDSTAMLAFLSETLVQGSNVSITPTGDTLVIAASGGGDGGGADGREVILRNNGEYIQWQYTGATGWTNLVALADLKGNPGNPGNPGAPGPALEMRTNATHIQWRVIGAADWLNLVALADLKGNPGDPGAPGSDSIDDDATSATTLWSSEKVADAIAAAVAAVEERLPLVVNDLSEVPAGTPADTIIVVR